MSERKRRPKSATWEDRLSTQVGLNIAAARARADMTAQELSDVLVAGGVPVGRPAISQIENGQRAVSLAEALAIAAVLGVAPADLIYDPSPHPIEALPGQQTMNGAEAADWVRGDLPLPDHGEDRGDWLADGAQEKAAGNLVNQWTRLSRTERLLHMHHRAAQRARGALLAAADQIDRLNAQQALNAALAPAVYAARNLDLYSGTFMRAAGVILLADTQTLVDQYKDLAIPELGVSTHLLSAAARAGERPGASQS